MELSLNTEQRDFVRLSRGFLEREAVPHRIEWDRVESIDPSFIPRMGEIGFFGLTIPERYGGIDGDMLTYVLALEELGRVDSSLRGLVSVSLGLVGKTILARGTEQQKERWLPGICDGTGLACFALTEPDSGSDAGALKTTAVRTGDEYVVNGSKMFITNGTWAKVCLLFARTGGPGARGVSAFLVDTGTPGFQARPIKGKLGLRGQATAELSFSDMRIPASCLLGAEGEGFKIAMGALDKGRISVASGCVGIIAASLEASVAYVRSREQFGRPIGTFQLVQDMIAQMSVDVDAARMLVWRACDLVMRGEPFAVAASKAKYFASEAAVRAADNAVQIHGGYGYIDEFPAQKFLRDARVMTLYEGTSQIQKVLIARAETGFNAFV
jgi:alkylation response protein AidB-like acyl-CoA dehydrogenase